MQKLMGQLRRCIEDYHMIEEGDRIAVGVSGGKDSLTLLVALAKLLPTTAGINAVVRTQQMGARLPEIGDELVNLALLTLVYGALALVRLHARGGGAAGDWSDPSPRAAAPARRVRPERPDPRSS